MRIPTIIFAISLLSACSKSKEAGEVRLLKTISTDNYDSLHHTQYTYDNQGRITSILQNKNDAPALVQVKISYDVNAITLVSFPDYDPAYTQTTEVRLTIGDGGRMIKRIENTHRQSKPTFGQPPALNFRYDTLLCEYDAAGLLKKTTGSMYDSNRVNATFTQVMHANSVTNFTIVAGNVTASDEYLVYPITTRNGGITTIGGGSSEFHKEFKYSRSYPNLTDFKNAAVLNEYKLHYEPNLNRQYKNMPDQVLIHNIDKDQNGAIIFSSKGTIDLQRVYNKELMLSAVTVTSRNTPFREIKYYYDR